MKNSMEDKHFITLRKFEKTSHIHHDMITENDSARQNGTVHSTDNKIYKPF